MIEQKSPASSLVPYYIRKMNDFANQKRPTGWQSKTIFEMERSHRHPLKFDEVNSC